MEPYKILGVDAAAGPEEIKTAFRYLSKKYHPDRSSRPGSNQRFLTVMRAYKSLNAAAAKGRYLGSSVKTRGSEGEDLFALGSRALTASNPAERRDCVRRLGFTGRKAAYLFLRRCLSDRDESVIAAAVRAIADLSAFQAAGEIAALWMREGEYIRSGILETAEATGEPLFKSALDLAVKEGGPWALRAKRILSETEGPPR